MSQTPREQRQFGVLSSFVCGGWVLNRTKVRLFKSKNYCGFSCTETKKNCINFVPPIAALEVSITKQVNNLIGSFTLTVRIKLLHIFRNGWSCRFYLLYSVNRASLFDANLLSLVVETREEYWNDTSDHVSFLEKKLADDTRNYFTRGSHGKMFRRFFEPIGTFIHHWLLINMISERRYTVLRVIYCSLEYLLHRISICIFFTRNLPCCILNITQKE